MAQNDSINPLHEVVVSGFQTNSPKATSLNIEPYSLKALSETSPFNLSDALAKIPGVSQLTTGNSISKPVIRGVYGNRILVLLSGLRFDNQQWQDEHGLGLSQIGIDRVEIIKGPASILYGSDAMGGLINIVEEKPTEQKTKVDFSSQFYSNTLGHLTTVGVSKRNANKWSRLRLGTENHADYFDGHGTRVLNSRNSGYYLKAGFGFEKERWKQENSYNFSFNQYGFILEELNEFFAADERWTRKMNGPHHNVILNMGNTQNTFYLKKSVLKVNGGFQSNLRQEDEGGGQISLNMHLFSLLQSVRWEKDLNSKTSFVFNQQFTFENNTNYGGRIIVPDANMLEGNVAGYLKRYFNKLILEMGLSVNSKIIKTIETRSLNGPGEIIQPFTKNKYAPNAMLGLCYNPNKNLVLKSNTATGFRAPNLAELSSNGLHEGVYRYEIGNPNLKSEQNINADLTAEYNNNSFFITASGFSNKFFNYVYLAPTNEKFYGFPVYRYKQQDAILYGGEMQAVYKPTCLKYFQVKEMFSATRGMLSSGGNLPFIPALKLNSSIRFEKDFDGKIKNLFVEPAYVYVFAQNNPSRFETPTKAYFLVNVNAGINVSAKTGDWRFSLVGNNLTNTVYADHLSRLKYYGLYNQGINFALSIRKEFKW